MRTKRNTIIIVIIICAALVFVSTYFILSNQQVEQGNAVDYEGEFDEVMSLDINQRTIRLKVNKEDATSNQAKFFMSKNMNLMIPLDVVKENLGCAANVYDKHRLVVAKGNTKAITHIGDNKIEVNNGEYSLKDKIIKHDGVIFIPSELFANYLGFSYDWDSNACQATLKNTTAGNNLPTKYNYKDEERMPKVKDQGDDGTCWAYATLTALESSLLPEESFEFSEKRLLKYNRMSNYIADGGDYEMSMAYLLSWKGPVLKSEENDNYAKVKKHVQQVQIIPKGDYQQIKEMVFKYGGVESSMYIDGKTANERTVFYNPANAAYCYKGLKKPNHDVVIIGWDDEYSKDNFNTKLVKNDGAFICMNSWGEDFGENGIFYVSYECSSFSDHSICYTQVDNVNNYDHIYQADSCGWTGAMGFEGKKSVYFSNVYEADSDEKVEAVGFYATEKNLEYEIFLCDNFKDVTSLNNRNHITAKGKFKNKGFYTVKLDGEYKVSKGKKFAIIVKVINADGSNKLVPVEVKNSNMKTDINLSDGEGYLSAEGEHWQSAENQKCNICLKAYTKD